MIITGKCACGRSIGIEPHDLGKKQPPQLCVVCSGKTLDVNTLDVDTVFETLHKAATGKEWRK